MREASGRGLFEYAFSHKSFTEAIAAAVPPERAAARHRRVARVLEELYADRASELSATIARHYELAGDGPNAARCYLTAVRRSIGAGRVGRSAALGDRALSDYGRRSPARRYSARTRNDRIRRGKSRRSRVRTSGLRATRRRPRRSGVAAPHPLTPDRVRTERQRSGRARNGNPRTASVRAARRHCAGDCILPKQTRVFAVAGLPNRTRRRKPHSSAVARRENDAGVAQALCCLANVETHRGNLSEAEALFDEAERAAALGDRSRARRYLAVECLLARVQSARHRALPEPRPTVARPGRGAGRPASPRLGHAVTRDRAQRGGNAIRGSARALRHAVRFFTEAGDMGGTAGEALNQAVLETRLGCFDKAVDATEKAVALFEGVT